MRRRPEVRARVLAPFLTVTALACASPPKAGTASAGEPVGEGTCFNVAMVDSFSPVGTRFVYVRETGDSQYLLTLDSVYPSLRFATGITISGDFSWVCSNTGATIAFRDAGRPVSGRILGVEAVASLDEARRLAAERSPAR